MEEYTRSKFDRDVAGLMGGNNLTVKATTVENIAFGGEAETFIIQTVRDEKGDNIIIKYGEGNSLMRLILPPKAAAVIARQKDAITAKSRRNTGRASAQARKDRGELPGFMKKQSA